MLNTNKSHTVSSRLPNQSGGTQLGYTGFSPTKQRLFDTLFGQEAAADRTDFAYFLLSIGRQGISSETIVSSKVIDLEIDNNRELGEARFVRLLHQAFHAKEGLSRQEIHFISWFWNQY